MINFDEIWKEKCKKYDIDNKISIFPPVKRIIVIGDIHGDYEMMRKSLKIANLIDDYDNWTGEDTYVVQVGDQIDRCRPNGYKCEDYIDKDDKDEDLKILYYFTNLHKKALRKNGAVISLLGNHELMNIDGNLEYVSRAGLGGNFNSSFKSKEDRKKQFSRGNEISNFLACTRYVAVIIGSNLFAHAGIVAKIADEYDLKSINQIMTLFLLDKFDSNKYVYDELHKKKHMLSNENTNNIFYDSKYSPLWNRIYGHMGYFYENNGFSDKYKNENEIKKICAHNLGIVKKVYQVDKIYVGHTPMLKNGIQSVCEGKVWLTDYGSSNAFDIFRNSRPLKQAQVLEILNDKDINILKETELKQSYYYRESSINVNLEITT